MLAVAGSIAKTGHCRTTDTSVCSAVAGSYGNTAAGFSYYKCAGAAAAEAGAHASDSGTVFLEVTNEGFTAFMKKELLEAVRSYKLVILLMYLQHWDL